MTVSTRPTSKTKPVQKDQGWTRRLEDVFGILSPEQGEKALEHLEQMRGREVNLEKPKSNPVR